MFESLNSCIKSALIAQKITQLTGIQRSSLQKLISSPHSKVVLHSATGTGKTLAFLLPIFIRASQFSKKPAYFPSAFILVPSATLARQTLKFAQSFGAPLGLRSAILDEVDFGKILTLDSILRMQAKRQKQPLVEEVKDEEGKYPKQHILIASLGMMSKHAAVTPAKLTFLMQRIPICIFDEFDSILEGADAVEGWKIFECIRNAFKLNPSSTFIGTCATLPRKQNPFKFWNELQIINESVDSSATAATALISKVQHQFIKVSVPQVDCSWDLILNQNEEFLLDPSVSIEDKMAFKAQEMEKAKKIVIQGKLEKFVNFLHLNWNSSFRMIVFFNSFSSLEACIDRLMFLEEPDAEVNNEMKADEVKDEMKETNGLNNERENNFPICPTEFKIQNHAHNPSAHNQSSSPSLGSATLEISSFHSGTSPQEKTNILEKFCNQSPNRQKKEILLATSLCARGIDFKDVDIIVNFDLPSTIEEYLHRAGRTGRMGKEGEVLSLALPEESQLIFKIQERIASSATSFPASSVTLQPLQSF